MFDLRLISRLAAAAVIAVLLCVPVLADTVRLKDGSIIKGTITGFVGGKFTIEIGEGSRKRQLIFDSSEVESIEFEAITRSANVSTVRSDPPATTRYEPVRTEQPVAARPVADIPQQSSSEPAQRSEGRATSGAKPVELPLKVLADSTANGWTNSGWIVKKGQRIRITGAGEVSLGNGKRSTPAGLWDLEDSGKLLQAVPTGALLAVIGDDNNDFIYIGSDREFVAARDGALFLGINEGNLSDNSGTYDVKIEIFPS